ncbi:unnamed protein product [Trifolium pratense]|uniref:Uncharacterized protein n=1 Tax=Trifolium pratense TaxID=57577 RepID=A0ACB0L2D3_TRIPR|nr:unnamed protein product [Trifolium pratense]
MKLSMKTVILNRGEKGREEGENNVKEVSRKRKNNVFVIGSSSSSSQKTEDTSIILREVSFESLEVKEVKAVSRNRKNSFFLGSSSQKNEEKSIILGEVSAESSEVQIVIPSNDERLEDIDVIFDEIKEWDWCQNERKYHVTIAFEESDSSDLQHKQAENRRSSRTRSMPARLRECEITPDDGVTNEAELVHFIFLVDVEPVNVIEALKDPKWTSAMEEELESIEKNGT